MLYLNMHLKDHAHETRALTPLELGVFSKIMIEYCDKEKGLNVDLNLVARQEGLRTEEEKNALKSVVELLFVLDEKENIYRCEYLDNHISEANFKSNKRSEAKKKYWEEKKKKEQENTTVVQKNTTVYNCIQTENRKQITDNREQITDIKENIKEKNKLNFSEDHMELSKHMANQIKLVDNNIFSKIKFDKLANDIRIMSKQDKFSLQEMKEIFDWGMSNSFWKQHTVYFQRFRKNALKIKTAMNSDLAKNNTTSSSSINDIPARQLKQGSTKGQLF